MKITFLCSDPTHPVNIQLDNWISLNSKFHDINLVRKKSELVTGDILFLISCSEILHAKDRSAYQACLVLHASNLPYGRGWSPHIWSLINGEEAITLSLLEAEDQIDSGRIWRKKEFDIPRHALWNEINEKIFEAEIEMINFAVDSFGGIVPELQNANIAPSYHPRRTPEDSRLDASLSLEEQFDLLRVCDPQRYPAFFDLRGYRYKIVLEKMNDKSDID